MGAVLDEIANLLTEFTPYHFPVRDAGIKLDDPFMGVFEYLRSITQPDGRDQRIRQAVLRYGEVRHFLGNISTLLYFFRRYLTEYANTRQVHEDFYRRLTLDLEKLLTDIRSFLDSVFKLVLLYSEESAQLSKTKRASFGAFAEWTEKNDVSFQPPLSFMRELAPWGLTIRQLRTDYLHLGLEAAPFFGEQEVYFNPYQQQRPVQRMPALFYPVEHPNRMRTDPDRPIYLRKFIIYLIAPVFALNFVLGRYFDQLFADHFSAWPRYSERNLFQTGQHIQELYDFIQRNEEVLDPKIYQDTYFTLDR